MQVGDPIQELNSAVLYQRLQELDPDLARRAENFLREIAPVLATTLEHFPYYTRHDAHHGFRVLCRVAQIVNSECLSDNGPGTLTAIEIYLIILAAYAHDLGMTVFPGEEEALLAKLGLKNEKGWKTDSTLQKHLRDEHSRRGGEYIQANAEVLQVPLYLTGAIDRIMKAHNLSIGELEAEIPSEFAAQELVINLRQIALIICVADAIEFSETRVVEGVLSKISADASEAARVSYRENMKHACVGDGLAVGDDGRIVVSGNFADADVLGLTHASLDQIEGWIREYCDVDRRLKTPRLRVRPEPMSRAGLTFQGGRFERLGIRLNKRNVIDLIASNAVWREDGGLAVRELLQNAVEACRYRDFHASLADEYQPQVRVVFDRDAHQIVVEDNGCGMSERTVLNNLLTVGSSRSAEPGYSRTNYSSIARFGVGFWSVFTIARLAEVETASFENSKGAPAAALKAGGFSFDVSLDELREFTVFTPKIRPCGTAVRLSLHKDINLDDVYEATLAQVLCSAIPIILSLDGRETRIPQSVPDVTPADLFEVRLKSAQELGIQTFQWRGARNDTELTLCLAYRISNGRPTFLLDDDRSILNALPTVRHGRTSICGFVAPVVRERLCIDFNRVGAIAANLKSPSGIEFSLDRRQLIPNAASEKFTKDITDLVHDGFREFLNATNGTDLKVISDLRQQSEMHGGNVFDQYTDNELFEVANRFPDLASIKIYPLDGGDPIYIRADELGKHEGTIVSLQKRPYLAVGKQLYSMEIEGEKAARQLVAQLATQFPAKENIYLMEADRTASWIFDADPDGVVSFKSIPPFGQLPLLISDLKNIDPLKPTTVLTKFHGRWSGAIYLRRFEGLPEKKYVFLGRHRLAIDASSKLALHVQDLINTGRRSSLIDLTVALSEDEEGHSSSALDELLNA